MPKNFVYLGPGGFFAITTYREWRQPFPEYNLQKTIGMAMNSGLLGDCSH